MSGPVRVHTFAFAPNPRKLELFMKEKGIELETVVVNLAKGEQYSPAFLAKNANGGVPVLELDDGSFLAESSAIIEYLEELYPEPSLLGASPPERARTREAERRVDYGLMAPITRFFFNSSPFFAHLDQSAEVAAKARAALPGALERTAGRIGAGPWVLGERLSVADFALFAALEHGLRGGITREEWPAAIGEWFDRMAARDSVGGEIRAPT